jgi:hypothetical protein
MTIPASAFVFPQMMDPSDLVDFEADMDGDDGMLESNELIENFTLTLLPEAVALGLTIVNEVRGDDTYVLENIGGTAIRVWLEIDPALRTNAAFLGGGVQLPMELTVWTTSTPSRRRQRTLVVGVNQR